MKAHLSKDELEMMNMIEEFTPKEEELTTPTGVGLDLVKKFMPGFMKDKSGNEHRSTTPEDPLKHKSTETSKNLSMPLTSSDQTVVKKTAGKLSLF